MQIELVHDVGPVRIHLHIARSSGAAVPLRVATGQSVAGDTRCARIPPYLHRREQETGAMDCQWTFARKPDRNCKCRFEYCAVQRMLPIRNVL
jgi:hypothetical protein